MKSWIPTLEMSNLRLGDTCQVFRSGCAVERRVTSLTSVVRTSRGSPQSRHQSADLTLTRIQRLLFLLLDWYYMQIDTMDYCQDIL